MTLKTAALLLAATLGLGLAQTLPASPAAAQTRANWATTMAATPAGHMLGNPAASVKLVTFISYSCPHCAAFEHESDAPLRAAYIRSGRVNHEVRPFIRNVIDLAATLAVECGAENRFWDNHRAMLRGQGAWMNRATSMTPAQTARWNSGPVGQRLRAVAADLQFYQLLAPRGYTAAQLDQCLNDEARARALAATSQAQGTQYNLPGTPAFLINDALVANVFDWASLQARLDAAMAAP